jgi:C2H2 transcription facotor
VETRLSESQRHDMGPPPMALTPQQHQQMAREALEGQSSGRQSKRQAWYGGPTPTRTSPEDSSSSEGVHTPAMTAIEVNPMIMPSNGLFEHHGAMPPDAQQSVSTSIRLI